MPDGSIVNAFLIRMLLNGSLSRYSTLISGVPEETSMVVEYRSQ